MKFKVGDKVRVTSGKDKGREAEILAVFPDKDLVIVEGANQYVKHQKPMSGRAGEKLVLSRPLSTAKIAIINDKGEIDRIGYQVAKDGTKTRIFKKTGKAMTEPKPRIAKEKK